LGTMPLNTTMSQKHGMLIAAVRHAQAPMKERLQGLTIGPGESLVL
jgi:hypothetical protein